LQTDLGIKHGAHGVITDIILNLDEPPLEKGAVVKLKYLPECVLAKLSRPRAAALPNLEEGVIPIQRVSTCTGKDTDLRPREVEDRFPITGAYFFTD
jgi:hypothetical protein